MSACNIERWMEEENQIYTVKKKKRWSSDIEPEGSNGPAEGWLRLAIYHFQNKTIQLWPVTIRFDLVACNCRCFIGCADAQVFSITVLGLARDAVDCNRCGSSMSLQSSIKRLVNNWEVWRGSCTGNGGENWPRSSSSSALTDQMNIQTVWATFGHKQNVLFYETCSE